MSWQGNECFIVGMSESSAENCDFQILENVGELLHLYGEHGNGWYLLGDMYGEQDKEEYGSFNPTSAYGSASSCYCWLPNPFMEPGVLAMEVHRPHDLMQVAFEAWDNSYGFCAYAGDGSEPLEHMVLSSGEYDMRGE